MELVCWIINGVVLSDECITARGRRVPWEQMRVPCRIDELLPPNGSHPGHVGGKVEVTPFFLGLLECLLAQEVGAAGGLRMMELG